ncbi:MAG: aspartate aminotransferase family protein [Nitrososphaerales archaeon]
MIDKCLEYYKEYTPKSQELYLRIKNLLAGGVSHNVRYFHPYPLFIKKAKDQYLWDEDENKYVDFWLGHMALILGHSPKIVVDALKEQLDNGTHLGTVNRYALELAELVNRLVPCAEMVRFTNTGSEATMYATRLARAYTNKKMIVKIEGGWHGFNTNLLKNVSYPFEEKESLGLLNEEIKYVVSIPFNSIDESLRILRSFKDDIACVIVEPLLGNGCIPADKEYLKALREETERLDSLLIFDEVITGFRLSLGGAQEYYGIKPDLATLGKILGGGFPIGAIVGKKEIMNLADPTLKRGKSFCKIGGGTFSENPFSMIAGAKTLEYLKENGEVYDKLNGYGNKIRKDIKKVFEDEGLKAEATGLTSLFLFHFLKDDQQAIKSAKDFALSNRELTERFFFSLMAKYRLYFLPGHTASICSAHTKEDIDYLISSCVELIKEIKENKG